MPADPFMVAKATRTVAVVSKTPTAAIVGTRRAGGRIETDGASARTSARAGRRERQSERERGPRAARGDDRPRDAAVRGRVEADDEEPERERGDQRQSDTGCERRPSSGGGLPGEQHAAAEH